MDWEKETIIELLEKLGCEKTLAEKITVSMLKNQIEDLEQQLDKLKTLI